METPPEHGPKSRNFFFPTIILIIAIGLVIGNGLYVFVYANGFSYFTHDPAACKNCHVMNQVYESWMKGGHQHVATCSDCHVPDNFVQKWLFKAENGLQHGYAFTFKKNPYAFTASDKGKAIIQNNCIKCHKDIASNTICAVASSDSKSQNEPLRCVSCHRQVGHAHNF